jgi:multidrug efflux pump subunit AcrB
MIDVEQAVSRRKPVHAAAMIDSAVLPALTAQIARVRAVELSTVSVRKLQLRIIESLEQRMQGLAAYQSILSTGTLDTLEVVAALRVQRDAESALLEVDRALEKIRPVPVAR